MATNSTCVCIYPAPPQAMAALRELRRRECDMGQVSVLAHSPIRTQQALGVFRHRDGVRFSGPQADRWQPFVDLLGEVAWLQLSDTVSLLALGHIVVVMLRGGEAMEVGGGFSPHGAALHALGIPRKGVDEYEQALHGEQLLLLVHGARAEVERACEVLHSEEQQVTVHVG